MRHRKLSQLVYRHPLALFGVFIVLAMLGWRQFQLYRNQPDERAGVVQKVMLQDLRGLMESMFDNTQQYPQVGAICAPIEALKPSFGAYPKERQDILQRAIEAGGLAPVDWLMKGRNTHPIRVGVSSDRLHYVFVVEGTNNPDFVSKGKKGDWYGCDCSLNGVYCETEDMPL